MQVLQMSKQLVWAGYGHATQRTHACIVRTMHARNGRHVAGVDNHGRVQLVLRQAVTLLPDATLVAIITFGSFVYLNDLLPSSVPSCILFRGTRALTKKALLAAIGPLQHSALSSRQGCRFLVPLGECEFTVEAVLDAMAEEGGDDVVRPCGCCPPSRRVRRLRFDAIH
jgi:hypothetical protein